MLSGVQSNGSTSWLLDHLYQEATAVFKRNRRFRKSQLVSAEVILSYTSLEGKTQMEQPGKSKDHSIESVRKGRDRSIVKVSVTEHVARGDRGMPITDDEVISESYRGLGGDSGHRAAWANTRSEAANGNHSTLARIIAGERGGREL
jgi:hypothetical protein